MQGVCAVRQQRGRNAAAGLLAIGVCALVLLLGGACRRSESAAPVAGQADEPASAASKAARVAGGESPAAPAPRTSSPDAVPTPASTAAPRAATATASAAPAATRTPASAANPAAPTASRTPTTSAAAPRAPTALRTPGPATPHPDTPDPCRLVTASEAATALGGAPIPPSPRRGRDSAEVRCTYTALAVARSLAVSVWKGSEARPVYEFRKSYYSLNNDVQDVPGLGEAAFIVPGDEGWVNVLKGDIYLSIALSNDLPNQALSPREMLDRALAAARTAVARL